jgi:hypothetical protein
VVGFLELMEQKKGIVEIFSVVEEVINMLKNVKSIIYYILLYF